MGNTFEDVEYSKFKGCPSLPGSRSDFLGNLIEIFSSGCQLFSKVGSLTLAPSPKALYLFLEHFYLTS